MRLFLALLMATGAVRAADMGEWVNFNLDSTQNMLMQSFNTSRKLNEDEVLKVQLHPMGRKNARPTTETPVHLWISSRDDSHSWMLPWKPGGGHPQQWLEVLLCHNDNELELLAQTTSDTPLPLRWRVSTENVKLGKMGRMKSTPADVSYRRYVWPDGALAVDLEVSVLSGARVCASLAVARRCVTHPHELTDSHLLQRVLFARGARLSVSKDDAPDGFWLYLIPEVDNTKCTATAARGFDSLPPPAKTIEVSTQERAFTKVDNTTPRPMADFQLPPGDKVLLGAGGGGDWAPAPPPTECERLLSECHQQCPVRA